MLILHRFLLKLDGFWSRTPSGIASKAQASTVPTTGTGPRRMRTGRSYWPKASWPLSSRATRISSTFSWFSAAFGRFSCICHPFLHVFFQSVFCPRVGGTSCKVTVFSKVNPSFLRRSGYALEESVELPVPRELLELKTAVLLAALRLHSVDIAFQEEFEADVIADAPRRATEGSAGSDLVGRVGWVS